MIKDEIKWTTLKCGSLALWHRPGTKVFPALKEQGCSHILTLMSKKEGADLIEAETIKNKMSWLWLPLENAKPVFDKEQMNVIKKMLKNVKDLLDNRANIFIHCSAGIHRTGMFVYALLLSLGFNKEAALNKLYEMRSITKMKMSDARSQWAEQFEIKD